MCQIADIFTIYLKLMKKGDTEDGKRRKEKKKTKEINENVYSMCECREING